MRFQKTRPARSDKYQHLILESAFSTLVESDRTRLENTQFLDPNNQPLLELKDKLYQLTVKKCKEVLTEKQYTVLMYHLDGYTQMEIANILGVNQSSITKCINGNTDYSLDKKGKVYGGMYKKLSRLLPEDPEIKNILDQIQELNS